MRTRLHFLLAASRSVPTGSFRPRFIFYTTLALAINCIEMLFPQRLPAQGSAGDRATEETRYITTLPTAGTLKRGSYAVEGFVFAGGGAAVSMSVGIAENLSFGISYGAGNVIGSGAPNWNPLPGAMVRYRLLPEDLLMPAVTLGFDSQGRGAYTKDQVQGADTVKVERYERKAPGFFAVASKNFSLLGYLTLHGGLSYSVLELRDDRDLNAYLGIEKTIGPDITLAAQYDFAFNDNSPSAFGKGKGFLDLFARWSFGKGITLELGLLNVSDNLRQLDAASRTIRLEYTNSF